MSETEFLVVGGGLSGLSTAMALSSAGRDFLLLEGRVRLGGRVLTCDAMGSDTQGPALTGYDLGPTWVWPGQPRVAALFRELGIETFQQYRPGDLVFEEQPDRVRRFPGLALQGESLRVAGGIGRVVSALANRIPERRIRTGVTVTAVTRQPSGLQVTVRDRQMRDSEIRAETVLITVPPRLAVKTIRFDPPLPEGVEMHMAGTPTWMAGHAKVLAIYRERFWASVGCSGEAISRVGPLAEIHDASPRDGGPYALFGFVGVPADQRRAMGCEPLRAAVVDQLQRLFGAGLSNPERLLIKDWNDDDMTATEDDRVPPRGHPEYGYPADMLSQWDGRLMLSGSETAYGSGGLIEGALESSEVTLARLGIGPTRT